MIYVLSYVQKERIMEENTFSWEMEKGKNSN